jgi:hypothetical protein
MEEESPVEVVKKKVSEEIQDVKMFTDRKEKVEKDEDGDDDYSDDEDQDDKDGDD